MKKVFFISMLAVATIVACGKEEEATPQVQEQQTVEEQTVSEKITIMKSDETGIVIRVGEGEEARDSIIPIMVPYFAPSVIKGQVVVQVGEGDNVHDSIVYIWEPVASPHSTNPVPPAPHPCDTISDVPSKDDRDV